MEPTLPFRERIRRGLASIQGWPGKLFSRLDPQPQKVWSQRMCPFCGLITPRDKRCCMECGKALRSIQTGRKDAREG